MSGHLRTPWKILRDPELDPLAKIVLQVVISHVGEDGFQLGRKTIAREAKMSTSTVRKSLPVLVERRLLVVERRFENGVRKPDFFRAGSAWLAACADEEGGRSEEGGGRSEGTPSSATANRGVPPQRTREVVTTEVVTTEVIPPPQVPPLPDAEQSAAEPVDQVAAVAGSEEEDTGISGREEPKGDEVGGEVAAPAGRRLVDGSGRVFAAALKHFGWPDAETGDRCWDEVGPVLRNNDRVGYLLTCVRAPDGAWHGRAQQWNETEATAASSGALEAALDRYGHLRHECNRFLDLGQVDERLWLDPRLAERDPDAWGELVLTAWGGAISRGLTFDLLASRLADVTGRPWVAAWLAEQAAEPATVAEPATEATPWPESGKDWTEESTVDNDEFWPPLANVDWGF